MPWSPPGDAEARPDPALDPVRDRVGILHGGGSADGAYVLLQAETHWSRTGGHLWWSRWSAPREAIHAYLRNADGRGADWVVSDNELEAAVSDWLQGVFRHARTAYAVRWQDEDDAARIRDEFFPSRGR